MIEAVVGKCSEVFGQIRRNFSSKLRNSNLMKILSNRLPANIHRENAYFDMVTASVTIRRLACLARSRQLKFHHARRMAE
jgi:hypothetical protein